MIAINRDAVPAAMQDAPRWICWRRASEPDEHGRFRKLPIDPRTGQPFEKNSGWTTDSQRWVLFEEASARANVDGVGFVVGDGWAYVDKDKCVDKDGVISEDGKLLLTEMYSYSEISPSRTGIKIICRGQVENQDLLDRHVEVQGSGGFTTVTGQHIDHTPTTIEERTRELDTLISRRPSAHVLTSLLAQAWPGKNHRHDAAKHVGGYLGRRKFDPQEVEIIVRAAARIAKDEEVDDRVQAAGDSVRALLNGQTKVTGGPELAKVIGDERFAELHAYLEMFQASKEEPSKTYVEKLAAAIEREDILRKARAAVDAKECLVVDPPACLTLTERLAMPQTEIAWRIHDLMPVDTRVMIAAQFKAGKTTLVQNLIRSLVDGDPFLGRLHVAPLTDVGMFRSRVALLDFEMSERQLVSWFRDQQIQNTDRVLVLLMRGAAGSFDIRIPDVRARWAERLREQHVQILIIDCLRPIMDALGLNEHSEAGLLLTAIDALLKEAGISEAIVVHHMGHNGERSRGDSRLRDWPDVEWRLVREDEDPASDRFLSAFGRDVECEESKIGFNQTGRRLTLEGGSRRDAKTDAAMPFVLEAVRLSPTPLSKNQVEKMFQDSDISRDTVRKVLRLATRDGQLVQNPNGPRGAVLYSAAPPPSIEGGNDAPPY